MVDHGAGCLLSGFCSTLGAMQLPGGSAASLCVRDTNAGRKIARDRVRNKNNITTALSGQSGCRPLRCAMSSSGQCTHPSSYSVCWHITWHPPHLLFPLLPVAGTHPHATHTPRWAAAADSAVAKAAHASISTPSRAAAHRSRPRAHRSAQSRPGSAQSGER